MSPQPREIDQTPVKIEDVLHNQFYTPESTWYITARVLYPGISDPMSQSQLLQALRNFGANIDTCVGSVRSEKRALINGGKHSCTMTADAFLPFVLVLSYIAYYRRGRLVVSRVCEQQIYHRARLSTRYFSVPLTLKYFVGLSLASRYFVITSLTRVSPIELSSVYATKKQPGPKIEMHRTLAHEQ